MEQLIIGPFTRASKLFSFTIATRVAALHRGAAMRRSRACPWRAMTNGHLLVPGVPSSAKVLNRWVPAAPRNSGLRTARA